MEVDCDVEGQLLQQFSSLGTTDKEVLVAEFQKLLGNQLNAAGCAFFLDMNNWNLQAAVCSYYDYEQPKEKVPSMALVSDITIGEGEAVPPGTRFVKTWRIKNSGTEQWPPGCSLRFISGEQFGPQDRAMVDNLEPHRAVDVSIEMTSPQKTGIYQGQWRMSTPTGMFFGEIIWVILTVEEAGLLGLTQQLSNVGDGAFTTQASPHLPMNPFASPVKSASQEGVNSPYIGSPNYSILAQHGTAPNSPSSIQNGSLSPGEGLTFSPPPSFQSSPSSLQQNSFIPQEDVEMS